MSYHLRWLITLVIAWWWEGHPGWDGLRLLKYEVSNLIWIRELSIIRYRTHKVYCEPVILPNLKISQCLHTSCSPIPFRGFALSSDLLGKSFGIFYFIYFYDVHWSYLYLTFGSMCIFILLLIPYSCYYKWSIFHPYFRNRNRSMRLWSISLSFRILCEFMQSIINKQDK